MPSILRLSLLLLCVLVGACGVAAQEEKPSPLSKSQVWNLAKDAVRLHLKSPSSASFGGILSDTQDPDKAVQRLTETVYGVTGWVDADNSFGAKLRQNFYCELRLEDSAMHIGYFEMDGKVISGESVLPKLVNQLAEATKKAAVDKLMKTIVNRTSYAGREFLAVKTDLPEESKTAALEKLAQDLSEVVAKPRLAIWVYDKAGTPQGVFTILKQKAKFYAAPFKYPDPFQADGFFAEREWSDPSGKFRLKAKFAGALGQTVTLVDSNGKNREVELAKLSERDQLWVSNSADLLPK